MRGQTPRPHQLLVAAEEVVRRDFRRAVFQLIEHSVQALCALAAHGIHARPFGVSVGDTPQVATFRRTSRMSFVATTRVATWWKKRVFTTTGRFTAATSRAPSMFSLDCFSTLCCVQRADHHCPPAVKQKHFMHFHIHSTRMRLVGCINCAWRRPSKRCCCIT
jgi:hypothetical protein